MPCNVRIEIRIEDEGSLRKALSELGLLEAEDRNGLRIKGGGYWNRASNTLIHRNLGTANIIKQRYGVVRAETLARIKGWKAKRVQQEDGQVQVVIRR